MLVSVSRLIVNLWRCINLYYQLTIGDIAEWLFSASVGDVPLILTEVACAGGVTPYAGTFVHSSILVDIFPDMSCDTGLSLGWP